MAEKTTPLSAFEMYNMSKKKQSSSSKLKKLHKLKLENKQNAILQNQFKKKGKRFQSNGFTSSPNTMTIKNSKSSAKQIFNDKSSSSVENTPQFKNKFEGMLEMLIAPLKLKEFFATKWEQKPTFIKRNVNDYYKDLFSTEKLDSILRENSLFYTRNIDVVSYTDGKRETHNPEGRAIPAVLWDYYANGCSIRILNPHTYCPKLHSVLASLQEYFGTMVGANAYLTPPGSQGFAPHYDDIEAFILQLEGRKHWKLYNPLTNSEVLPRFSSKNFDRSELKEPSKEVTLEAGDLLYFPRGIIHEGYTDKDMHSLHVTISVYQKTAYIDLMEHLLKPALTAAANNDVEFRKGLPIQYLKHVGFANAQKDTETRQEIIQNVKNLLHNLIKYVDVDSAADQLGKTFMCDSLPPVPSQAEKRQMVHEDSEKILKGQIVNKVEITLNIEVRLLRYHCVRIVKEAEDNQSIKIYYNTDNAKYYHGEEPQFIVIDIKLAPAIEYMINSYPKFVGVSTIPLKNNIDKMQIVSDLWERGLLVTQHPLSSNHK